jgi:drug/metabolite transporter (DMT)-like permease
MSVRILAQLIGLGGLFASAFVLLRVTAPAFGPILLIDLRVLLAAVVLAGWAIVTRRPVRFSGPWHRWAILGALNAAAPFTLVAWAELHLPASLAAVSVATVPMFAALFAALRLREALTPPKMLGLVLGLVGVVMIGGGFSLTWGPDTLVSIFALLVAAVAYAAGGIYAQQRFTGVPRLTLVIGNLAAAGVLLAPLATMAIPAKAPTGEAVAALVVLSVVSTAFAFFLYFRMIEEVGATTASLATYFVPAFAALLGAVFLDERLSILALAGMAAVVTGAAIVTGVIHLPSRTRWRPLRT